MKIVLLFAVIFLTACTKQEGLAYHIYDKSGTEIATGDVHKPLNSDVMHFALDDGEFYHCKDRTLFDDYSNKVTGFNCSITKLFYGEVVELK